MFLCWQGKQHVSNEPHGSAAWAYISTILFGVVLIFYVDTFVEDRYPTARFLLLWVFWVKAFQIKFSGLSWGFTYNCLGPYVQECSCHLRRGCLWYFEGKCFAFLKNVQCSVIVREIRQSFIWDVSNTYCRWFTIWTRNFWEDIILIVRGFARLHIVVASPLHIVVTAVGIIIFEYIYGMDFSFFGFIVCATVLGLGDDTTILIITFKGIAT